MNLIESQKKEHGQKNQIPLSTGGLRRSKRHSQSQTNKTNEGIFDFRTESIDEFKEKQIYSDISDFDLDENSNKSRSRSSSSISSQMSIDSSTTNSSENMGLISDHGELIHHHH